MIILFSSNESGGVLQLVIQILKELQEMGSDAIAYIPEDANVSVPNEYICKVSYYEKIKTLNRHNKEIEELADSIVNKKPQLIWYFENAILTTQLSLMIPKNIKQLLIIHDAGSYHPSNIHSLKKSLHNFIRTYYSICSERKVDNIVLLSSSSKEKYIRHRKINKEKSVVLTLGAHIPNVSLEVPPEIQCLEKDFFLFFGRIDKYKGICNMVEAFNQCTLEHSLVIAGSGDLTEYEKAICKENDKIILVNRYITDGEMISLFENSIAVVLPYIEATQSGVLPISYKLGKPVITSDVEGLTQFVVNKKTGLICHETSDYIKAFQYFDCENNAGEYGKSARRYYEEYMEWKNNINGLFHMLNLNIEES